MTNRKIGWNDLFLSGSVVDLDVGEWRARMKLKPKDLGIDETPEVHKALSLGSHRLAPKEAFEEIREIIAEARRAIDQHSLNFPFIKGARYVPDAEMEILMPKLRSCAARVKEKGAEFAGKIGEIMGAHLPMVRQALEEAAKNPEAAKNAYDRILAEYPTPEEIQEKFYIVWNIYAVSGAKTKAAAEEIQKESESVKSVIGSMMEQVRGELSERVSAITALVAKGGKIPEPTLAATREVLDRVEKMNIFGDAALERQTKALRAFIAGVENEKINGGKKAGLLSELAGMQAEIEGSVEEAVRKAEENLTKMGRRKIAV